jgi:hypothetical protein
MEELAALLVVPVVGFVAKAAAKKGIELLKKKGVQVPPWVELIAPPVIGGVAGVGTTAGLGELPSTGDRS